MKHYIIYHNADLDGFCSGAIVKKALMFINVDEADIVMIGYNYGDGLILDKHGVDLENDIVYIVDLSLEDVEMQVLSRHDCKHTWIDHHISAIEKAEGREWKFSGIRKVGDSASLLAWKHYFSLMDVPDIVYYVDRYDVFKKDDGTKIPWDTVLCAQHGMRLGMRNPSEPEAYNEWNTWFDNATMTYFIKDGKTILSYFRKQNQDVAKRAFQMLYHGHVIAMVNYDRADIEMSEFVPFPHDGMAFFTCLADKVVVSLRKRSVQPANILGLAKEFGGGGHECACGFSASYKEFESYFK